MRTVIVLLAATLVGAGACSSPGGPAPSLSPRAAEAIDPRVPVAAAVNGRPVGATLAARLATLVAEARRGDAAFGPAAARARQLASRVGGSQSESWVVAQEALSAAIAARAPTARAAGDIDALGGDALERQGGLAPADLAAIQAAAAEVAAMTARQAGTIAAIQRQLGL
jgi:hypothetical protein